MDLLAGGLRHSPAFSRRCCVHIVWTSLPALFDVGRSGSVKMRDLRTPVPDEAVIPDHDESELTAAAAESTGFKPPAMDASLYLCMLSSGQPDPNPTGIVFMNASTAWILPS
jgi:hypothetical protein